VKLPQPGDTVGPYRCLRLLATGGMGAVYEARRADLPRSVALKVLLAPDDLDLVARFHREVEACGRMSHPNVVGVHDSGVDGRYCYLVMELVRGDSLQGHLDREGPSDCVTATSRILEAAAGIAHAHAAGVLHRDLKPSNLLWDRELKRVRVVDFGLTGRLSQADSLTVTGEVLGTPGYLAPEQLGAGEIGPAADV
jgi:eukaryotic-like serine/threonine-protein kinase